METSPVTHDNPGTARPGDFYQELARRRRAETIARAFNRALTAGARLLQRLRRWYEHRALQRTLERLEPWQLKDIGISRNDLQAIADGTFLDDPTRRPRHPRLTVIATTEASWIERSLPGVRTVAHADSSLAQAGNDARC